MIRQILFTAAALGLCAPLSAAEPIAGRWITSDKDAVVAIAPCGAKLCGKIDRFLVTPPQGVDQRDVNNRDAAKRNRKILGMQILTGFTADGNEWRGEIYDPKSGRTYRSVLERKGERLNVKGCLGPFCKTQTWARAK